MSSTSDLPASPGRPPRQQRMARPATSKWANPWSMVFSIAFIIAGVAIALLAAGCEASPAPATTLIASRAQLESEFDDAYPMARPASGSLRQFELVASEVEIPLVDGATMHVWAYNGQVPGPTLRIRLGDTLRVAFTNRLRQETTIHWHGVRVPNAMDGVPHTTQPPIQPGASFTYEFTPKDAGTYWFHPHVRASEQVERGLYGVLIVEDERPPPYARDVTWVIDDWLLDEQRQIFAQFNTLHDLSHDGRWGNIITVNGRTDTSLKVSAGERIRLRLLNASNGRVYVPDFGELDAQIIAVDGLYLREPVPLGRFELAPGNRMDLDLTVRGIESRAITVAERFQAQRPKPLASIVVDGVTEETPAFESPARANAPAWRAGLGVPITKEFELDARRGGPLGIEWTLNGEAFAGHQHARAAARLERGVFARLRLVNTSFRLHPMHLHGMFFKVLARDGKPSDEPFFRDTVLIHPKETVDIGLVPLDEGLWMMHCHILEHAEAGMMTLLEVRG